jgi:branched-chain amino acid transport system ATP-binding protein
MLEIVDLTTSYGGIEALRNVSLKVAERQMVALIGPNGAGKTTLLNTISGLLPPKNGKINFECKNIVNQPAYKISRLGLIQVPEGRQILGPLSVQENLLLGKLALGQRHVNAEKKSIDKVYNLFPKLAERRNQVAGSLSGGEQQMLAIGRALMGNPRLLLLDEPSLGLAPLMVNLVFNALKQLSKEGITILLVEQNARRAIEMTDYTYILEQGRLVYEGESGILQNDSKVIAHYLGVSKGGTNKVCV